jgi:hypothetical protein
LAVAVVELPLRVLRLELVVLEMDLEFKLVLKL